MRCHSLPPATRTEAVLCVFSRRETLEQVSRRTGACPNCLHEWTRVFLTHATGALDGSGAPAEQRNGLALEARKLARELRAAKDELEVWTCIAEIVDP